jgi:hypothetical protein
LRVVDQGLICLWIAIFVRLNGRLVTIEDSNIANVGGYGGGCRPFI